MGGLSVPYPSPPSRGFTTSALKNTELRNHKSPGPRGTLMQNGPLLTRTDRHDLDGFFDLFNSAASVNAARFSENGNNLNSWNFPPDLLDHTVQYPGAPIFTGSGLQHVNPQQLSTQLGEPYLAEAVFTPGDQFQTPHHAQRQEHSPHQQQRQQYSAPQQHLPPQQQPPQNYQPPQHYTRQPQQHTQLERTTYPQPPASHWASQHQAPDVLAAASVLSPPGTSALHRISFPHGLPVPVQPARNNSVASVTTSSHMYPTASTPPLAVPAAAEHQPMQAQYPFGYRTESHHGSLNSDRDDTLTQMMWGARNPVPATRAPPPVEVQYGSDTSFNRPNYIPQSAEDSSEALSKQQISYLDCLTVNKSAVTTRASSPLQAAGWAVPPSSPKTQHKTPRRPSGRSKHRTHSSTELGSEVPLHKRIKREEQEPSASDESEEEYEENEGPKQADQSPARGKARRPSRPKKPTKPRRTSKSIKLEDAGEPDESRWATSQENLSGSKTPSAGRKRKSQTEGESETSSPAATSASPQKDAKPRSQSRSIASVGTPQVPRRENLTPQQKRDNHIKSEQRRRSLIKDGFADLSKIVPRLSGGGFSKANVVNYTAEWIEELKEGNMRLREQLRLANLRDDPGHGEDGDDAPEAGADGT
ncbi:hypothetical protein B0T24DRAFT_244372 [Lasiosphaeria ovina]|uniref:BHLH domain-containing protein n=1 Tax=Lasiosphaeria ovina TaxID=92902 RepID=A0AAE0KB03_9PEZI|nr:hypothetical protein B0T24DRAFT_244372 [Lasiosphaeria ovina]